jgi:hypothetical protein
MVCPLCGERKAKRACPALNQLICAVCCGTKRLVEINCPADCIYLTTAKAHPPAVVQRQLEHDRALLLPLLGGMSERQARVFLMFAALIARYQGEAFQKLQDEDIALATEALAATLETSVKGIVYEHRAATVPADRLLTELKGMVAEITKEGGTALERDAAIALRRLEAAAREIAKSDAAGAAFQQLLVRLLLPPGGPAAGAGAETATAPASSLIIP